MRAPASIEREIALQEDRLAGLRMELARARRSEALAAASRRRHQEVMQKVLERMEAGWWVSGDRRLWWHSPDQTLVEPANADDLQALDTLAKHAVVARETVRRKVSSVTTQIGHGQ
ncbi:hypothetical protein [Halorhodospira sp. 9622]|uniref:hypothetical protein n=1 Tax=Halorhodospira sp. 9622 TaxID=2899136 RepID=UPI001EE8B3CE|nr:hypothetical protein [Halorhodospira sp. 9622]MCG5538992.1 hypothetical protein [Halorhodospira sp. 9622]